MVANNTEDPVTLFKRGLAMRILYYGFDDADLDTIITTGQSNGYADGVAYSTHSVA